MKKLLLLSLAISLILLNGCVQHHLDNTSQVSTTQPESRSVSYNTTLRDVAELVYEDSTGNNPQIIGFSKKNAFMELWGTTTIDYFSYNMDEKKTRKIGTTEMLTVGSASYVIMQDRYYYFTQKVIINGNETIRLLKLDSKNNTLSITKSSKTNEESSPFVYLSKLNENEFLMVDMIGFKTQVVRYNCNTDESVEIISATGKMVNNIQTGNLLSKACAMDGKIYVLIHVITEQTNEYQINVYDREGKQIKTISADAAKPLFENTSPLRMVGIGGYIVLENWNMKSAIYKISGNEIVPIVPPEEKVDVFISGMESYYSSQNNKYIFFKHQRTDT
jgi:hypothetical protein